MRSRLLWSASRTTNRFLYAINLSRPGTRNLRGRRGLTIGPGIALIQVSRVNPDKGSPYEANQSRSGLRNYLGLTLFAKYPMA
jgi:hypothetical protein